MLIEPSCLVVQRIFIIILGAERAAQFFGGGDVHSNEQSATLPVAPRPAVNVAGKVMPATQIEVADAKIGTFGNLQGFL